jgi:hypothetical protein
MPEFVRIKRAHCLRTTVAIHLLVVSDRLAKHLKSSACGLAAAAVRHSVRRAASIRCRTPKAPIVEWINRFSQGVAEPVTLDHIQPLTVNRCSPPHRCHPLAFQLPLSCVNRTVWLSSDRNGGCDEQCSNGKAGHRAGHRKRSPRRKQEGDNQARDGTCKHLN